MKLMMILFALFAYTTVPKTAVNTEEAESGGAYLVINGKFGGEITHGEIAANTSLGIEGCAAGARIYTYTLVLDKAGKTHEYTGKSDQLTKTMVAELKTLSKGDSFTFEKVRARLGGDDDISVMARMFTITG